MRAPSSVNYIRLGLLKRVVTVSLGTSTFQILRQNDRCIRNVPFMSYYNDILVHFLFVLTKSKC